MKDVITKGTGKSAKLSSSMAVAGKSGTTSNSYDTGSAVILLIIQLLSGWAMTRIQNFASDNTHKKYGQRL